MRYSMTFMLRVIGIAGLLQVFSLSVCGQLASSTGTETIQSNYHIHPCDQLDVKLFYNPELNEQVTVRSDGRISLQLVGDVHAAGLTPMELAGALQQAYAKDLNNPQTAVIVHSSAEKIFVDGEVNRPGLQAWNGSTTILQALSEAGGLKDTARTQQILIIRKDSNNRQIVLDTSLKQLLDKGKQKGDDIMLAPYDVVYVPISRISNLNRWVDQYVRKNIPITFGVLNTSVF